MNVALKWWIANWTQQSVPVTT